MIKLLVKSAEESREVEFNGETITIGRSSENVLKLNDKKASRHHAKIEKIDGEYRVVDLESGNGTKLNGRDVPGSLGLNKGDEIQVGLSTLYVLNLDAPAKAPASPAPVVAAVAPPPPPAPAPAPAAAAPEPKHTERRSPITRRARYASKSSSGALVAIVAVFIIGGAIFFAATRMPSPALVGVKPRPSEKKTGPTINEANEAYQSFKAKAGAAAPSEETLAEADRLADRYGEIFPDFNTLAADVRSRRNAGLTGKSLEAVKPLVDKAVAEHRYGDAIDALKALRGGSDADAAGKLLVSIESKVDEEYKALVEAGNKLIADKKYEPAAESYREAAPKFRNTRHHKTVLNKPENLMAMAQAEADALKAREARAKAEAAAAMAKAETPKPPPVPEMKPEPKPEMKSEPKPAMAPEMKPAMPKPEMAKKPEMKPEMPKPPPPPPPPPPPEPKKEEPKPEAPRPAIKKPDVLCDVKKTVKGMLCVMCDRTLGPDDIRGGNCKKCDEKPKKIDLCLKRFFVSDCEHKKVDDRPVFCCGKVHDFPQEDRARVVYLCEGCGEGGDVQSEIKHGSECKNRLSTTKICAKSGTPPHAPDKK